jgi:hypothetical protein
VETLPQILDDYDRFGVADTQLRFRGTYYATAPLSKQDNHDTATAIIIPQSPVLVLRKSDLFPVSDVSVYSVPRRVSIRRNTSAIFGTVPLSSGVI